ncbi:MAG: ASCH domain-containing protein [Acidimicrobiales bacterium]
MLIAKRYWEPIQRGEVVLTFRRWKRSQVKAGNIYRTGAGRLLVEALDLVDPAQISDADAVSAGSVDADALRRDLRGDAALPVYRIAFRHLDEPDPRTELANDAELGPDDLAALAKRLERLDRADHGPWTTAYLEVIEAHPERRAPELAEMFGRETQPFKLDVRKLKNLGLTLSFRVGYRLSPRGQAYLDHLRSSTS